MSTLTNWWSTSRDSNTRFTELASADFAHAIVRRTMNPRSNRTPDIKMRCGDHFTGYRIALTVEGGVIRMFHRRDDDVPAGGVVGYTLPGFDHPSRFDVHCAQCGRSTSTQSDRLLYLAIQATMEKDGRVAPFSLTLT